VAELQRIPTLTGGVDGRIRRLLAEVRVSMPGIVQRYDSARQRADVQPAIREGVVGEDGERLVETIGVVTEVPVCFLGTGEFSLTWPVKAGDEVLLIWSAASLDLWLARGGVVDPEDDRRHQVSDAVAIPGLRHAALPGSAVGSGMVLAAAQIQLGSSSALDPVIRKSDLDALINVFNLHVHTGVTTGPGSSGPPVTTAPLSTGSSKVTAE
jgi:hypothetical protein